MSNAKEIERAVEGLKQMTYQRRDGREQKGAFGFIFKQITGQQRASDPGNWYKRYKDAVKSGKLTEEDSDIARKILARFNEIKTVERTETMTEQDLEETKIEGMAEESTFAETTDATFLNVLDRSIDVSEKIQKRAQNIQIQNIDLSLLAGRLSEKYNMTEQQRELMQLSVSDQQILLKNLKTVKKDIDVQTSKTVKRDIDVQTSKEEPKIEIAGTQVALSSFMKGMDELAKQISELQGNLNKPLLRQYQTKKQPFVKVVKQEQTKFKPTLNQLFQTRSVIC